MKVEQTESELPSEPLLIRKAPVKVGEKIFLIGVPYSDRRSPQNTYTGIVTARSGDRFRYDIQPPVNLSDFSGAPIVDESGLAVGIMTIWFHTKMEGDLDLEAGGEDATAVFDRIENANP